MKKNLLIIGLCSLLIVGALIPAQISYAAQNYVIYNGNRIYYNTCTTSDSNSVKVNTITVNGKTVYTLNNINLWTSLCNNNNTTVAKPTKPTTPAPQPEKPAQEPTKPTTPAPQQPEKPAQEPTKPTTPAQPSGSSYQLSAQELQMINLVNQERQKAGVKPLEIDYELARVARIKSQDMKDKNYFSHTSPTYGSPFEMMKSFGIKYRSAGENIALNSSVEKAHAALMNSEGHRNNILNPGFTHIGIGIVDGRYYTQMFISK